MERRVFLKAMFGAAAVLSVTSLIGADAALAKPLAEPATGDVGAAHATAPVEDMPAANATESWWYRRRRVFWRRRRVFYRRPVYWRPRRRVYWYRPRRVFYRRRYWW